jgi:hypothetical protein
MEYHVFPLALSAILVTARVIAALFNMPRNEFPDFTIRQGSDRWAVPGRFVQTGRRATD